MSTSESRPDRGFRRAMLCGLVGFLGCILVWMAVDSGMLPPPEAQGRLLFSCFAPATVTGLVAKNRRWSWCRIAAVYATIAVALVAISVLPKVNGRAW